jgi:hypothetical protein
VDISKTHFRLYGDFDLKRVQGVVEWKIHLAPSSVEKWHGISKTQPRGENTLQVNHFSPLFTQKNDV